MMAAVSSNVVTSARGLWDVGLVRLAFTSASVMDSSSMIHRQSVHIAIGCALPLAVACGAFGGADETSPPPLHIGDAADISPGGEGGFDGGVESGAVCDLLAPFEFVTELAGADEGAGAVNTPLAERGATLSTDEKTLYFHRELSTSSSAIFVATRDAPSVAFRAPVQVKMSGSGGSFDANPKLTFDGNWLYFDSDRTNTAPNKGIFLHSLWRSSRASDGGLDTPQELENVLRPVAEPFVTDDELFFTRTPAAGRYTIASAKPVSSGGTDLPDTINSPTTANTHPVVSADRLALYFARKTTPGSYQVLVSLRSDAASPFQAANPLVTVGQSESRLNLNVASFAQSPVWISEDSCRLYFEKTPTAPAEQWDLFVAVRTPSPRDR